MDVLYQLQVIIICYVLPTGSYPVMSYQYDNLNHSKYEIRLVEVLPELWYGIINCRLLHMTLSGDYTCLSYTWGSSQKPHQILINGKGFFVGANLHQFLCMARLSRSRLPIWIDAICINQIDPWERNHQVRLMGKIYGSARQVLVWLGYESGLCEDLLRLIGREDMSASGCLPGTNARLRINALRTQGGDQAERCFQAMNEICRSAYWNRTWTVQEFVLARDIRLVCGSADVDMGTFKNFMEEWTGSCYEFPPSYPPPHMRTIESSERVLVYCNERSRLRQSRRVRVPLMSLLYSFHDSQCADQEDRIYAMLSLAKGGRYFRIDYRLPTVELVFNTICFCEPNPSQELARLSSLLVSTLVMKPAEQRLVQSFVMQAQALPRTDDSIIYLPASVLEIGFSGNHEVSQDLTGEEETAKYLLGCPQDYNGDHDAQHLFDFVIRDKALDAPSNYYLVLIDFLWLTLRFVCVPKNSNYEEFLVTGVAINCSSQPANFTYVLLKSNELTGLSVRRKDGDGSYGLHLDYQQLFCVLNYMQRQRDAWDDEDIMNDLYFGHPEVVRLRILSSNIEDKGLALYGSEDDEPE